ncbi:hypothetical protein K1T71_001666 [Dendrolimus kikuchii]|uniref:Uncharacterized protein n=1 Tax=Dendrolimus kikuchii TaxID=765133 RepID=A0ACC1DEI9_9NEOP|nr:hypothetical protein K1T71_001666 [Dendrolimus kikuchii]
MRHMCSAVLPCLIRCSPCFLNTIHHCSLARSILPSIHSKLEWPPSVSDHYNRFKCLHYCQHLLKYIEVAIDLQLVDLRDGDCRNG